MRQDERQTWLALAGVLMRLPGAQARQLRDIGHRIMRAAAPDDGCVDDPRPGRRNPR